MASVQELIDAANAQKSPGISAMEGLARGYLNEQQQAIERAKTLILLEQHKREQEQMIENQKRMMAEMSAAREQGLNKSKMEAGIKPDGVTPQQRLETVSYEQDEQGNISKKATYTPTKKEDDPLSTAYKIAKIESMNENLNARKETLSARNTQALSKRIEDLGVPEAITQFQIIAQLIPKSGDVPGFGPMESLVPGMIAGDDARALRQAVQALQNVKIRDRSGAAVTAPEFVRLREEFGTGKFKTEEQLRQGLNQAVAAYRERVRNAMAGFDDETKSEYLSRDNIANPLDVLSSFDFSAGSGAVSSGKNWAGSGIKKVNRFEVSVED